MMSTIFCSHGIFPLQFFHIIFSVGSLVPKHGPMSACLPVVHQSHSLDCYLIAPAHSALLEHFSSSTTNIIIFTLESLWMTVSYTLDASNATSLKSFFKLLFRWRGSVWKAVLGQLFVWTVTYLIISCVYRYVLDDQQQSIFENLVKYLDSKLDSNIPLTFMLGFFVSFVVGRWGSILNGIGWIEDTASLFCTYIRGRDPDTRSLKRTLVRYMVLTQALVLRDISIQVRKRFPTMDTLSASGLMTEEEMEILIQIKDPYSRYWAPIQWAIEIIYECKAAGTIESYYLMNKIVEEMSKFRHGLSSLLKYDWVPVPLVYPQVVYLAVRFYFLICLIGRQFIVTGPKPSGIDLWLPVTTMVQFIVYFGWIKVAESLLNPLGEDDDDLESNYIIDKNLITGYSMVEEHLQKRPPIRKDSFAGVEKVAPLYSLESAERSVHPLLGSAAKINLVRQRKEIVMTPHKNKLSELPPGDQKTMLRRVCVRDHNAKHAQQRANERQNSPDSCLSRVRSTSSGRQGQRNGNDEPWRRGGSQGPKETSVGYTGRDQADTPPPPPQPAAQPVLPPIGRNCAVTPIQIESQSQ